MKHDVELSREILIKLEKLPPLGFHNITVDGRSDEEISYHVKLLHDAGLIEAEDLSSLSGMCWKPKRLTNSGHDFLDAARNNTTWKKWKGVAFKSSGELTLEAMKIALKSLFG